MTSHIDHTISSPRIGISQNPFKWIFWCKQREWPGLLEISTANAPLSKIFYQELTAVAAKAPNPHSPQTPQTVRVVPFSKEAFRIVKIRWSLAKTKTKTQPPQCIEAHNMTRSITSTTMFIFSDYRFRTCCSHSEALPLSPTRCLTRCGFRGGTHTFSWYIAWHWSREEKNWFLMFSFAPNTLRHRTCFDYNTKQNKKWKTTETSLSFFCTHLRAASLPPLNTRKVP